MISVIIITLYQLKLRASLLISFYMMQLQALGNACYLLRDYYLALGLYRVIVGCQSVTVIIVSTFGNGSDSSLLEIIQKFESGLSSSPSLAQSPMLFN